MKLKSIAVLMLSAGALLASDAAFAQAGSRAQMLTTLPAGVTVTDWYKQNVYDPSDSKIGEVMDVLVTPDGRISTLIVGVLVWPPIMLV